MTWKQILNPDQNIGTEFTPKSPQYIRLEGGDPTGVELKSSRSRDFSTFPVIEHVFENNERCFTFFGVGDAGDLWLRLETPTQGITAFRNYIKTTRDGGLQ